MIEAEEYRRRAATCRSAACLTTRPSLYLLDLAAHYDSLAAAIEAGNPLNKPSAAVVILADYRSASLAERESAAGKDDATG
jgi:hypothetical protein